MNKAGHKTAFFLDHEFAKKSVFGSWQDMENAAKAIKGEIVNSQTLFSFLKDSESSVVIMCHNGDFPGQYLDKLIHFIHGGGDIIWLGGEPFAKEWLQTEKGLVRGDGLDAGYPECNLDRHRKMGISPWWVAPCADLDHREQIVNIVPEYAELFGKAKSFVINGQHCQLMPFGAGRQVTVGSVNQGGSTYNRNDVISMVESGLPDNRCGGRIISCGFIPCQWELDTYFDFINGLIGFLEIDRKNKLTAGMKLERLSVPEGEDLQGTVSPRKDIKSENFLLRIFRENSGELQSVFVKSKRFNIPAGKLSHGRYQVRLYDGKDDVGISDWFSVVKPKQESGFKIKAEYAGKYATFNINGKCVPMQTYCGHANHRMFETIVPGFRDSGIHVYNVLEDVTRGWIGPGEFDWSYYDLIRERLLREDPDAWFFPRVGLNPPQWWIDSHPGSMWQTECGLEEKNYRGIYASYYDPVWRKDTVEVMTSFIEHILNSWYGHRFLGIFYQYGGAGEWGEEAKDGLFWADHHPVFVKWFREWLKNKYKNDSNLKRAWSQIQNIKFDDMRINNSSYFRMTNKHHHLLDDLEKDFELAEKIGPKSISKAEVPNFFRRRIAKHGIIRDPDQVRDVIDFMECYSQGYLMLQRDLSSAFKKAGKGSLLIGTFGGYYLSGPYEIDAGCIHTPYPEYLDATKDLDIISNANFYSDSENPTGDQVCQGAHESYKLHNKLYLQENDQRTCLTKVGSTRYGTPEGTIKETLGSIKRNWMIRVSRGAGLWWFDFARGFYDHPEILSLLEKLQQIYANLIKSPNVNAIDKELEHIAVFYSPRSHHYTVPSSNYLRRVAQDHVQRHFNRYGIPWELYFPEDMDKVPSRKVYLFLNAFYLTKKQRETIDKKYKRNGNILIWLYAPGIIDEKGYDLKKTSDLTGFKLDSINEWRKQRIEIVNHTHPAVTIFTGSAPKTGHENLKSQICKTDISDFGSVLHNLSETSPEMDKIYPQIFVSKNDKDAQVIGLQEETDRIAYAVKDFGDWKSVYASAAILPSVVMRGILQWGGIETHTDTLDNFYTNGDLVGLNSLASEYKTIRFPVDFKLKDLITGRVYISKNREVKIWVDYQDTFVGQVSTL